MPLLSRRVTHFDRALALADPTYQALAVHEAKRIIRRHQRRGRVAIAMVVLALLGGAVVTSRSAGETKADCSALRAEAFARLADISDAQRLHFDQHEAYRGDIYAAHQPELASPTEHYRFGVDHVRYSSVADVPRRQSYFAYALGRRNTPVSGEVILIDVPSPWANQAPAPVIVNAVCR